MIIKKKRKNKVDKGIEQTASEQVDAVVSDDATKSAAPDDVSLNLFDLDNIDFKQRNERRRGDRRRGFRRVDDRNLISRAREEANSIKEAALKEGYQAGLEEAKNDIQMFKESLSAFYGAKQEIYNAIAPEILEISFDISKKIIKKELSEDPQIILDNIKEIMNSLSKEESKIMINVNPVQESLLKISVPEVVSAAGLEAKVIIIPDENVTEGGCLITTSNGVIDATIEAQLAVIAEALKEV